MNSWGTPHRRWFLSERCGVSEHNHRQASGSRSTAQSSGTDPPGCGGGAHFPAFAVIGLKARACMIAKRIAAFENKEFLKI